MEHATDVLIEFVKLVYDFASSNIPQNAIIQHKLICGGESRTVPGVIVGMLRVVKLYNLSTCFYVIDLTINNNEILL